MSYPSEPLEGTTPLISDRFILTFQAGAAITMGQALYLNASDGQVYPTNAANQLTFVGIALTSQSTIGKKVSVVCRGLARFIAYGTPAVADQLTTGGPGYPQGSLMTDNTSKNTTVVGLCTVAPGSSGGTGVVMLW
jgi:hypothetical protein